MSALERGPLVRASYIFMLVCLFAIAWFKIATPVITVLFGYLVLSLFTFFNRRWGAVIIFTVIVLAVFYIFAYFVRQAAIALPPVAEKSIPAIIDFGANYGVDLPFDDLAGLKSLAAGAVRTQLSGIANFARLATEEFVFLIIGLVVAISIFLNGRIDLDTAEGAPPDNAYAFFTSEIAKRFGSFYASFHTVMGAQLIISAINTLSTGIFVLIMDLPFKYIVIVLTFLCGLLPIVGNLISNTVIFAIGMTVSPRVAVLSLTFLIALHKAEYFLNSKIIGGRIRNPMWLTLISLLVGERTMGIPGMILAPVILNFIKRELAATRVNDVKA